MLPAHLADRLLKQRRDADSAEFARQLPLYAPLDAPMDINDPRWMIEPDGAVALFADRHPEVPENAWRAAYNAVLDHYSAEDSARRQRKAADWPAHEAVLLASPFSQLERIGVIERRRTPVGNIEDRLLSLSSVSRDKIGARADDMIAALREKLAPFVISGDLPEIVESEALIALRPPR